MAKQYWARFGTGNPATYAGLSPTFITFIDQTGQTQPPPGISQVFTGSGLYNFQYTAGASLSYAFTLDGSASIIITADRYVTGNLDPADAIDLQTTFLGSTLIAFGVTEVALGNTILAAVNASGATSGAYGASIFALIGNTTSSFGSTNTDPSTLFGFLKRAQEFWEGNATFLKSTGAWSVYSRGSSTLLTTKILTNSTTGTTKL